ncbi:transmembrane protein 26-like X2 [Biomphalaria pfeifferi]|uniref:Transmembrane protein 26-like X2 n=1 Tax=Biomphalaria pfeifferi TaxID=112525 RepID=A0AAD8B795_BIOPF|nr:transmembrane protein 26-like X2 [Biomphalaria pfeifferi]
MQEALINDENKKWQKSPESEIENISCRSVSSLRISENWMAARSEKAFDYHRKQGDEIEIKHKLGVTNTSSSLVAWNGVSVLENTPLQVSDETGLKTRVQGDLASPLRYQASVDRIDLKSAFCLRPRK